LRVHSDFWATNNLPEPLLKKFLRASSTGNFSLLHSGHKCCLIKNQAMKKHTMNLQLARENGNRYENTIPMRLWAEDDLPKPRNSC